MIKPPYNLKCEYLVNPICIDVENPRFSWYLEHEERNQIQSAYQIIVSSDKNSLESKRGVLWDSGKVVSDETVNIPYNGPKLKSDRCYYWWVKWWDRQGKESEWSNCYFFETALFEDSNWKAEWISRKEFIRRKDRRLLQYRSGKRGLVGRLKEVHAVYLRKEFPLPKKIKSAKAYVCGLGYYEFRINGKKVGTRVLEPAQTDYNKIALYSTFDITDYLQSSNAVGVILGNGRCIELFGFDFPKLVLMIIVHYTDGSNEILSTDESWKVSKGPIRENGIYYGETYDARLEMPGWDKIDFDDSGWDKVSIVRGHNLASQMMQPIQVTKTLKPVEISTPIPETYIFDFGQNFTGYAKLKVKGSRGTEIQLRFSELLYEDGTINTATNGGARATDIFILKGNGNEIYEPHFTYHGFRYVELTGFPGIPSEENLEGIFFHSDVEKVGDFSCSNQLINQIHNNIIWGQLSNLMSIPTDCPQRDERHGWMGDAHLAAEEAIFNFDMARFYTKYLRDIKESQKDNGSISDVVPPYWKLYPADPAWGTAYITIAWYLYWYYNDTRILEEHYDGIKKYVDFLTTLSKDNLIFWGKYGDWCPPSSIVSRKTPVELTSSWYYYHDNLYLSKIAKVLGYQLDYEYYIAKSEEIKGAFNDTFLKNVYDVVKLSPADYTISQTSNILPLYLKIVPDNKYRHVLNSLVNSIKEDYDYHFDTGIVGTRHIFEVLTNNDYPEIIYKMINQKSFPGYGYMIKEGATTLWERWEKIEGSGMNSHNHIMNGSVDSWFYKSLTGISLKEHGWKMLQIKPFIPFDMLYASSKIDTIKGTVVVSWEKEDKLIYLKINLPVGVKAKVWIPIDNSKSEIREGDQQLYKNECYNEKNTDIEYCEKTKNSLILIIGSGFYEFKVLNN